MTRKPRLGRHNIAQIVENVRIIEQLLKDGHTLDAAMDRFGIDYPTYKRWTRMYYDYRIMKRIKQAEQG